MEGPKAAELSTWELEFVSMTQDLSRRRFLQGLGFSVLLAGCGSAGDSATSSSVPSGPATQRRFDSNDFSGPRLVALYSTDRVLAANDKPQRIAFAVEETPLVKDDTIISVDIYHEGVLRDQVTVAAHVVEHSHVVTEVGDGHQHSSVNRYFPLRSIFDKPGIYELVATLGSVESLLSVQIFEPSVAAGLVIGSQMPAIALPTRSELRDLDTLCTREPVCSLHAASLDNTLGNSPVALLIATPALCSTAYCGPVLETLLAAKPDYPQIEMVHAEVYSNVKEVRGDYGDPAIKLADHMKALDLEYEPALYLINADGVLVERIDNVFAASELRPALDALIA